MQMIVIPQKELYIFFYILILEKNEYGTYVINEGKILTQNLTLRQKQLFSQELLKNSSS